MKIAILLLVVTVNTSSSCLLENYDLQSEDFIEHLTLFSADQNCKVVIFRNVSGVFDGNVFSPILQVTKELKIRESYITSVRKICSLPQLKKLTITNNRAFPILDGYILENCDQISSLEISHLELNGNALRNFRRLQTLNIERTNLHFLSKKLLESLKSLVELRIANSQIPHLEPGVLCAPPNLVQLFLRDNTGLPNLTATLLKNCNKLTDFVVSGDGGRLEKEALHTMSHLKSIVLYGIQIEELTADHFRAAENLTCLHLIKNSLRHIAPDAFSNLKKLIVLSIHNSDLEDFPEGTFDALSSLRVLDLENNQIKSIENIKGMESLERLDVSWNAISDINVDQIKVDFPGLEQLSIVGNNISFESRKRLSDELEKLNIRFYGFLGSENC